MENRFRKNICGILVQFFLNDSNCALIGDDLMRVVIGLRQRNWPHIPCNMIPEERKLRALIKIILLKNFHMFRVVWATCYRRKVLAYH